MDLSDLNIPLELSRVKRVVTCQVEGIVEIGDLRRLAGVAAMGEPTNQAPKGGNSGDLSRIKEKHHTVARLMASGMQQGLVATIAGYTESYLSVLLGAPAMSELIGYYRAQHSNAAEVIAERLRHVSMGAVEKLSEKMDSDDGLNANELLQLAKLGLDRSGHGPQSKQQISTETHLIDHAELKRLNREARRGSREDIIQLPSLPAPSDSDTDA